jgi:thiamine biosynthesis lipoprotein ApbE
LNDAEAIREQIFQEVMIKSIVRGAKEQEKEKALERLIRALKKLEKTAQDLSEITKALNDNQIKTT